MKIFYILLAALIALLFTGCASTATVAETSSPAPSPTIDEEPSAPSHSAAAAETEAPLEPTAAAPSEPAAGAALMRLGTTSPQVRDVQQRLMDLGYLGKDKATQYYDAETRDAVALFQQNAGLNPTGEIDEASLAALTAQAAPTRFPPVTPAPTPAPAVPSASESAPASAASLALAGMRVGLDPGHQAHGNSDLEPVAPGSSEMKAKVASGTQGVSSGVAEFAVNMQIAEKLRALLEAQGAEVVMSRERNDVDISNAERAAMMNNAQADLVVRLHCNGDANPDRSGAFILIPSGDYTLDIQETSRAAAETILDAFIEATGATNLGLSERSDQTGFNWSEVPVIGIEMGHLTNPAEDQLLVSDEYQERCAEGICQGLIDFWGGRAAS